ncbi:unnamed protein product [Aphanomyces euteiches]
MDDGASEYDDFFNPALFVNERYTSTEYVFGDIRQDLLSSKAASTDHDLTGQVVLIDHERTVLELGAGAGLAGFVASQFATRTAITDGNDVVLRLLDQNADEASTPCGVFKLLWGEAASVEQFQKDFPHPIDIMLGADVVCWPNLVLPLLRTIKHLMHAAANPFSVDLFFQRAKEMGFKLWKVDHDEFLPTPRPDNVTSARELMLIGLSLDSTSPRATEPVEFLDNLEDLQTAC